jgi:hypothetical protein
VGIFGALALIALSVAAIEFLVAEESSLSNLKLRNLKSSIIDCDLDKLNKQWLQNNLDAKPKNLQTAPFLSAKII